MLGRLLYVFVILSVLLGGGFLLNFLVEEPGLLDFCREDVGACLGHPDVTPTLPGFIGHQLLHGFHLVQLGIELEQVGR